MFIEQLEGQDGRAVFPELLGQPCPYPDEIGAELRVCRVVEILLPIRCGAFPRGKLVQVEDGVKVIGLAPVQNLVELADGQVVETSVSIENDVLLDRDAEMVESELLPEREYLRLDVAQPIPFGIPDHHPVGQVHAPVNVEFIQV